jgi:N4-gp56 family major capsid protein
LGISLRQTEDQLTRDMLASTATFINAVGGVNGDTPTEITLSDCQAVTRTLLSNDAYTIMDIQGGLDKFGTAPIRNSFFALCNTEVTSDLDNVATFNNVANYPSPENILPTEYGNIKNLRFLISSIGSVFPNASVNGADVYNIFCVGMEAYACIEQNGYSAQFVYLPPSIAGGPLALNASVGYKFAEVPRITNDEWLLNLRVTLLS